MTIIGTIYKTFISKLGEIKILYFELAFMILFYPIEINYDNSSSNYLKGDSIVCLIIVAIIDNA